MTHKRTCRNCGDELVYRGGRPPIFCKKAECQNVRKNGQGKKARSQRGFDPTAQVETKTLPKSQAAVVSGLRAGLHVADAARGWMLPAAVTTAMASFAEWLSAAEVVPAEIPDGVPELVRFGMACEQAIHAWHVETGRIVQSSPAAVKDIWMQRLAPPELPADPQKAAAERVGRAKRLVAKAHQDEPDIPRALTR